MGGTLLPAGEYQVLHQMDGTVHIMVFKGIAGTKGEAKAKCNLVPLAGKASKTDQRYTENAKNEHVLQEMSSGATRQSTSSSRRDDTESGTALNAVLFCWGCDHDAGPAPA